MRPPPKSGPKRIGHTYKYAVTAFGESDREDAQRLIVMSAVEADAVEKRDVPVAEGAFAALVTARAAPAMPARPAAEAVNAKPFTT